MILVRPMVLVLRNEIYDTILGLTEFDSDKSASKLVPLLCTGICRKSDTGTINFTWCQGFGSGLIKFSDPDSESGPRSKKMKENISTFFDSFKARTVLI
jgi:hypothetical protein